MKHLFLSILLLAAALPLLAQQDEATATLPIYTEMDSMVVVHHDAHVASLLVSEITGKARETQVISGFRVQVYSSNDVHQGQTEALKVEKAVKNSTLGVDVYTTFSAPFWKVRVGDCRTKAEAEELREEVRKVLPELMASIYIVRDEIVVSK